ncbi:unnamed protein product, partial [Discosporangium mesarthrocarpum]
MGAPGTATSDVRKTVELVALSVYSKESTADWLHDSSDLIRPSPPRVMQQATEGDSRGVVGGKGTPIKGRHTAEESVGSSPSMGSSLPTAAGGGPEKSEAGEG